MSDERTPEFTHVTWMEIFRQPVEITGRDENGWIEYRVSGPPEGVELVGDIDALDAHTGKLMWDLPIVEDGLDEPMPDWGLADTARRAVTSWVEFRPVGHSEPSVGEYNELAVAMRELAKVVGCGDDVASIPLSPQSERMRRLLADRDKQAGLGL